MGHVRQLMGRITLHLHGQARERSYREMLDTYSQRLSVKNIKIISHSSKNLYNNIMTKSITTQYCLSWMKMVCNILLANLPLW